MLNTIDKRTFTVAIKQSYKLLNDISAANFAEKLIRLLDEELEPAVTAWISGKDIPDIEVGKYSVTKILAIRNTSDYLDAFQLLSEYKHDPEKGEKNIWRPVHNRRQGE